MYLKNSYFLFLISLLTVSCSDIKNTRYQDTSHLEMPPKMEIKEQPKVLVEKGEELENKGLGGHVSLAGSAEKPVLKIKKMFDRSWNIVEQALKLNEIEITDKDREQGVFYLLFDPDAQKSANSKLIDSMTFFLFKDEYEEAAYQLTVVWRDSDTEVSAELVNQASSDLLDDDEDSFDASVDGGAMLIRTLYKTIRDDLPLN